MKKAILVLFLVLYVGVSLAQQQGEQKTSVAVMNLESLEGISSGTAYILSNYLRTQMVNTNKFTIVTRENMDQIFKEQEFQMSGCTSQECIIQAGQLLGVRKMFAGSIGKIGLTYIIELKLIDDESGKIESAETEECAKCEEDALLVSLRNITSKITGAKIQTTSIINANAKKEQNFQNQIEGNIWKKDNSEMIFIPAGKFFMGSLEKEGNSNEHPQHEVYLDDYYIDKYEVTNEQFAKFLNEWGSDKDTNGLRMFYEYNLGIKKVGFGFLPSKGYEKYPVINVTWYGAKQYAEWSGKRLPTEAEWEKAARAGSVAKYSFGDSEALLEEHAWFSSNSSAL